MGKYRRVTFEDRCQIDAYLSVGMKRQEIARRLGFHPSTMGRELKRNLYGGLYTPKQAQNKAEERYRSCRKAYKITGELRDKVERRLRDDWSPEFIAGRFKVEEVASISHQAIYNHVHRDRELKKLLANFNHRGAGRHLQRNRTKERFLSIKERPKIVDERSRLGDWERDAMCVANREHVLVMSDRKSRYVLLEPIGRLNAKLVTELTKKALERVPTKVFTITNDNGSEFSDSPNQGIRVYHCTPRRPQERGTVENQIGRIRRYCTTKTPLSELRKKLHELETKLNLTPRKCLGYRTPYEVLFKTTIALAS